MSNYLLLNGHEKYTVKNFRKLTLNVPKQNESNVLYSGSMTHFYWITPTHDDATTTYSMGVTNGAFIKLHSTKIRILMVKIRQLFNTELQTVFRTITEPTNP